MTDEQQGSGGQPGGPGGSPSAVEVDSVQSPSDFLQDVAKRLYGESVLARLLPLLRGAMQSPEFNRLVAEHRSLTLYGETFTPEREAEK